MTDFTKKVEDQKSIKPEQRLRPTDKAFLSSIGAEPLAGSGFESEIPDVEFSDDEQDPRSAD